MCFSLDLMIVLFYEQSVATRLSEETRDVVYADLGPSSRAIQPAVSPRDNHVEYAQLNYQEDVKKTEAANVHCAGKICT